MATLTPKGSSNAEMLLLSPVMPHRWPSSTPRKRKVTPSSEASSPKKIAVVTSPGAVNTLRDNIRRTIFSNPLGWPALASQAQIDAILPLLPNPLFQGESPPLRHISLPFDLRVDPGAFNIDKNKDMLAGIFPDNYGLSMIGNILCFLQNKMPPKPWPKTIAGLPICFAPEMSPSHMPRPFGTPARRRNGSIAKDQNGLHVGDWQPLFEIIKNHFQDLGISITEVMYWGTHFLIVLEHRNVDHDKLPHAAANILCMYLFDDEMGRPSLPQARRITDPTPGNPDNSEYNILQPGLRVTSTYLPNNPGTFLSTTAGVLVKDGVGNKFMTVAAHGFPGECHPTVVHPLPTGGRYIGELIMEVGHTDIALVKLRDREEFHNTTFESEGISESIQLKRLASVKERHIPSIFLDSPDTGCLEGAMIATSFQRVPSDDDQPKQDWIFTSWCYMGQDSAQELPLPDGMCGSPIWTEDGDVLGFFRWAPKEGAMKDWCAGIAADELMKRGFEIVDTTDREAR